MTAVDDAPTSKGTPFPGSRKTYLQGSRADLRVPMREVALTTGDSVVLYDTSGPYTDETLRTDVRLGLPAPCGRGRHGDADGVRPARPGDA
jgi:phosphomethylpyrimidine synthase